MQDEVDAGRLVQPFDQRLQPAKAYHLPTRPGAQRTPEVAAVCQWLREAAADYARQWPRTRP